MDPSLPVAPESRVALSPKRDSTPRPVDVMIDRDALIGGLRGVCTCPQCGVNPRALPPVKPRTLQWVSPWVYFALLVNILIALILYYALRVRITTTLPLCADCDAADRGSRVALGLSFFGVFAAPIAFAIMGSLFDAVGVAAAVGFVAGLVGAFTASYRLAPALINCRKIDAATKTVTLRASPTWAPTLAKELPQALKPRR